MTVREYIGARYVPIVMGDWDNTKEYEPLSIVMYQGDSYTSRQFVPSGIEITNDAYWALTGNYNAQVQQYRNEVIALANLLPSTDFDPENTVSDQLDALDSRLDDIEADNWVTADRIAAKAVTTAKIDDSAVDTAQIADGAVTADKIADGAVTTAKIADGAVTASKVSKKKMIAIGDSFTVSPNPYADFVWADKVAIGLDCDLYNYAEGSTGFILGRELDLDFAHQLLSAETELEGYETEVEYIFIFGGFNDYYALYNNPNPGYTIVDVVNAAYSLISNAHAAFPNAKIVYIPLNWSNEDFNINARSFLSIMCNVADAYPYVFCISNAYAPLCCMPNSVVRYSDNVHPNTSGQAVLALFILGCIMGNMNERQTIWDVNYTSIASSVSPYSYLCASPIGTRILMNFELAAGTYTSGAAQVIANAATNSGAAGKPVPLVKSSIQVEIPAAINPGYHVKFKIMSDGAVVILPMETFTLGSAATVNIDCFIKR